MYLNSPCIPRFDRDLVFATSGLPEFEGLPTFQGLQQWVSLWISFCTTFPRKGPVYPPATTCLEDHQVHVAAAVAADLHQRLLGALPPLRPLEGAPVPRQGAGQTRARGAKWGGHRKRFRTQSVLYVSREERRIGILRKDTPRSWNVNLLSEMRSIASLCMMVDSVLVGTWSS